MTRSEKVAQLSGIIDTTLPQLIGKRCVFLDVAYYENIGDVLIWEGTECFLRKHKIKCVYRASKDTYDPRKVPSGVTIIMQGGGNFGDLWLPHQAFRLKVIANHPDNKIIILPQTVYYESEDVMKREAALLSNHKNLLICARDTVTENLLKEHFSNEVILLPDMAFCISSSVLKKRYQKYDKQRTLFLKRGDKELSGINYSAYLPTKVEVHDWPSYETVTKQMTHFSILMAYREKLAKYRMEFIVDWYAYHILRPHYVKTGVEFLRQYDMVYTTRLHVAILSTLLGTPFTFFDNSYGKNKGFFQTWLNDVDGIRFVSQ